MVLRLEHANLAVRDVDATIRFLQAAFPEFRIRFDSGGSGGHRWVHVGTDDTYIALSSATDAPHRRWVPYSGLPGVNHLGFEVEDTEAIRRRLTEAGYQESTVENSHPHRKRVYFRDHDGNDWEFVQYLTQDPILKNDYTLPDVSPSQGDA
jgi:catechol 2,3-dioxygenase-like lactoylglutathione lyase family enzyme